MLFRSRGQVGHVARNMKAGNLPAAIAILAKPANQPFHDQAAMIDMLAEPDEVRVTWHVLDLTVQAKQRARFFIREDRSGLQPPNEKFKGGPVLIIHHMLHAKGGSANGLSVTTTRWS